MHLTAHKANSDILTVLFRFPWTKLGFICLSQCHGYLHYAVLDIFRYSNGCYTILVKNNSLRFVFVVFLRFKESPFGSYINIIFIESTPKCYSTKNKKEFLLVVTKVAPKPMTLKIKDQQINAIIRSILAFLPLLQLKNLSYQM